MDGHWLICATEVVLFCSQLSEDMLHVSTLCVLISTRGCLLQGTVLRYISVHTMLHIVMWTYAIRLGLYALLPYTHSPW